MNAKKILLTVVLLLSLIVGATLAVSADSVGFGFSSTASGTVDVGESFSVTVSISGAPAVKSIALIPEYDASKLELVSADWSPEIRAKYPLLADFDGNVGVLTFGGNTAIGGTLWTMNFRVIERGPDTSVGVAVLITAMVGNMETPVVGTDSDMYSSIEDAGASATVVLCDHNYASSAWEKDGNGHWKTCSECGEQVGEQGAHTYDDACDDTCVCGQTRTAPHAYSSSWSSNGDVHWHECSLCHGKKDEGAHAYTNDCDESCNVCQKVRTVQHNTPDSWETSDSEHWKTCGSCSTAVLRNSHQYTDACDSSCNTCGYVRTVPHAYASSWSKNADKHWHECSLCHTKKDEASHVYTDACDKDCNTCGYVRQAPHSYKNTSDKNDEGHWYECSLCHAKKDEANHNYDDACDATCDTCGYARTAPHSYPAAWRVSTSEHWRECSLCQTKKDIDRHEYSSSCDETCDTCGYERTSGAHTYNETEWKSNALAHWHQCVNCDAKKDEAAHKHDNSCDTTCNVCASERTVSHVRTGVTWSYDTRQHTGKCPQCGENIIEDHSFRDACDTTCDDGCGYTRQTLHNYRDFYDASSHWKVCSVCGDSTAKQPHEFEENACDCGYVYTAHVHDLISHSEVKASCETAGTKAHYTCRSCEGIFADADGEQEMTADELVIAPTGHTEVTDEASEPTCELEGKTQGSHCSVCDTVLTEQTTIPKTDHTPETVKGSAPTCTEEGLSDGSVCSDCDTVLTEQTVLAPKGHVYGEWTVDVAPSEQYDGMQSRVCTGCGETEREIIAALGSNGNGADDAESSGSTMTVIIIVVVVVVLLGGAGVVAFILLRRR